MTQNTLYLIQSSYAHTDAVINTLLKIYTTGDAVILMGDAVLFVEDDRLKTINPLYILDTDLDLLPQALPSFIKSLTYIQFADLVLNFTRSVSLK